MCDLPLEFNNPVREIIHPNPEQDIILAPGGVAMTFVWCPAGAFMMGSCETELGHYLNETLHEEVIEEGFWIGKYPVTQEQYDSLTGTNPSYHQAEIMLVGNNTPVHSITHTKAMNFCELMNKTLDLNGYKALLPTSIQWEYACRAGAYDTYPKFCRAACIQGRHEFCEMSEDFYRIMYKDQGFRVVLNRVK